jgi:hypothetical protein
MPTAVLAISNQPPVEHDHYNRAVASNDPSAVQDAMAHLAQDNKFTDLALIARETTLDWKKAQAFETLATYAAQNTDAAESILSHFGICKELLASTPETMPHLVRYLAESDKLPRQLAVSLCERLSESNHDDARMLLGAIARLPCDTQDEYTQSVNATVSLTFGSPATLSSRAALLMGIVSNPNTYVDVKTKAIECLAGMDLRCCPQVLENGELSRRLTNEISKRVKDGQSPISLATIAAREDEKQGVDIKYASRRLTAVLSSPESEVWTKWGADSFESVKMVAKSRQLEGSEKIAVVATLARAIGTDPKGVVATALYLIDNMDTCLGKQALISNDVKGAAIGVLGQVLGAGVLDRSTSHQVMSFLKGLRDNTRSPYRTEAAEALAQRGLFEKFSSGCSSLAKWLYSFVK